MLELPVIDIKNLDHFFGQGQLKKQVLFDINLEIGSGEVIILTGPSGSGKTTLLTLIGGLRSVNHGSLKLLDQQLCNASAKELVKARRRIGYIFQAHNLHKSLTAQQNVQMGLELHPEYTVAEMRSKSAEMLEIVGLGNRINYYPE
ncbi:MAG TPA: ATP-binding cassette domain-containing protein, partial [Phormidium sp.]